MGKKFFYILTVLLFSLSTASADDYTRTLFPMDGGTTSDGIIISTPVLDGFDMMNENNELNATTFRQKATLSFFVTVPDGKVASIEYQLFIKLRNIPGFKPGNYKIVYNAKIDGKTAAFRDADNKTLNSDAERLRILTGKHHVSMEVSFTTKKNQNKCTMSGGIQNMYIHVHRFNEPLLLSEPICGQPGTNKCKCLVCGLDSVIKISPKYAEHSLKESSQTQKSCLSNMGKMSICEHCPYSEIEQIDDLENHDFDDNGTCRVCKLRKPRSNAEHSVYEIYEASEMRVLAEMVSIGAVPGNIGIDIKADLVFNNDTTMLPLGSFDHPFQGVLNGNGHRIRGIINCFQGVDCLGFVGVAKGTPLSHAVIANLIFDAGNTMKGSACVGGIVGYAAYTDIVNCASFGALEGNNYVGSIVGYADQQVSFQNCASVSRIRTQGNWSPMACGLINGHILNSYGAATNSQNGIADELSTTTFRHCFTTYGSYEGLRQVSHEMMLSYNMLELLNEESESPCFMMSQNDAYPIPVVNSTIQASPNRAIPTTWKAIPRRALSSDLTDDEPGEKKREVQVIGGYVNEAAMATLGNTVDEILSEDSGMYADFGRQYIATRSVSGEDFELFKPMCDGELLNFESYMLSPDSTSLKLTEYILVSSEKVKAISESIERSVGRNEVIDEYAIVDGSRNLVSRTTIEGDDNVFYQENIDGILRTIWSINTVYDESGNAVSSDVYSYNYQTGETRLENSIPYNTVEQGEDTETPSYREYVDSETHTIHGIFNDYDPHSGAIISRVHFIIDASNQYLLEILSEKMIDGEPYLTDGMYFVYDEKGSLAQSVAYGPKDTNKPGVNLRPYLYYEYIGFWKTNEYPTATKVPTVTKPSLQKPADYNVYDMHGRLVRKVTNVHDPFSDLPNGLYIYQGEKYLKRN